MRKRRQPSGAFFRRVQSYSEPKPAPQPDTWIRSYKESDAWLWTEIGAVIIGLVAVIPATVAYWIDLNDRKLQREAIRIDLEDRQTQRIAQAWESVTRVAPGNSGKGPALEYLNSQNIALVGLNLSSESNESPSYLVGVNLSAAKLWGANLSEADLRYADLSAAKLWGANLSGANLEKANLKDADLSGADLSGANLDGARLSGADLEAANLSGADLSDANLRGAELWGANLSGAFLAAAFDQIQIDKACGDEKTFLPKGFTIEACPEEWD